MKNISLKKVKPQIRIILEIAFAIIIAVVILGGIYIYKHVKHLKES